SDRSGLAGVEEPELRVGLGRRPLDERLGSYEAPGEPLAGDREVQDRALGGCAVEGLGRHLHLAHRVSFDPSFAFGVDVGHADILGRVAGSPGAAPQRLAAVDVGSNTVHVLVADAREQDGEGRLDDVAHYVETPPLGPEVTRTGRIGAQKAEEAIAALRSVVASA